MGTAWVQREMKRNKTTLMEIVTLLNIEPKVLEHEPTPSIHTRAHLGCIHALFPVRGGLGAVNV